MMSFDPFKNNGDEEQGHGPVITDILLPGEEFVVDHWKVGSGSAVRAGETIAFACRKSDVDSSNIPNGNNNRNTETSSGPQAHKRPNRRRKPQPGGGSATAAAAPKVENIITKQPRNSSSTTVPLSSTVTTLKERLAAKLASKKAEPCKSDEPEVAVKTTAMEKGKKQTFPIVSPASGLLRANKMNPKSMIDESQQKLYIGYIEECLHPTFLDGMCVVCGTPVGRQPDKSVVASAGVGHSAEMSSLSAIVNNRDTLSQVTVSGGVTMTVSERESRQMALLDAERLFGQKRLSLVLDLDHTLVHATSDARARQYLAQHNDVRSIRLPMLEGADPGVPVNPEHFNMYMHHYVKLRPNINEFFQGVQSLYEVTVYTAGTRQYAEEITMVLCRSLVGSSRDWEDLEHLRYQVFLAEEEYAKYSRMEDAQADNEQKKRKIEEAQEEDENGVVENSNEPPKKRKKVSFGFREVVDEKGMQKSDHITKEKLKSLQIELRKADDLEQKARELRQKIFGSRVFSRTELGDLGRDVKSLKRIFPCGGAMAAVVDDREDVWANAKDNNKSITKGEPPENLLLVRPYHWSPFVGFADVNNAAGADLSGSTPRKDSDPKNEIDNQLLWTKEILEKLHRRYFQQNEKGNRLTVPETLKEMRRNVLKGSTLVLSGLVPLHKQSTVANTPRPPIVRYAQSLGAKMLDTVEYGVTHVVAASDGTDKAKAARKTPGCVLVKPGWLMECYWSMTCRDVEPFLIGKGQGEIPEQSLQGVTKESNTDNSIDGSNESEDDDFAAEFEDELLT